MPATLAVLFDYGRTLVTFEYPKAQLAAVVERFRPRIAAALGGPAPEVGEIVETVLLPLENLIENAAEDEVRYLEVFAEAWRRAGMALPAALLYDILDAEQMVWDRGAHVDPDAVWALQWLRDHGIKRGLCSNAPFPGEMMRRQVTTNGLATLLDAIVFSSEVGKRKPAREMYIAALAALGVDAESALFVGDREREDFDGPSALGMRAVVCTAHAVSRPGSQVPTIATLRELPQVL